MHPYAKTLKTFRTASGRTLKAWSLPALARRHPGVKRLPHSMRIVLESVLRHCDGERITAAHVEQVATWGATAPRSDEIPFVVSRVVLQDFTGVPLLADLAAMRNVAERLGKPPKRIEPLVPVDLVVDHSVMIDHFGGKRALDLNMKLEFKRNLERYGFMKWGMQAFDTFGVVPPGFGIVHQVNLEYLARGVHRTADGVAYPDTLVGTDSHTTMINGIGVVGWGVGGIEAEAAMLGQPVYFLTPDVVGFELTGRLREGVTATDLVLAVTEILRREKVVGSFVEFCGEGTRTLAVPDRATIANMAPEYGATMGFFPVDEKTVAYFRGTGRTKAEVEAFEAYFKAQDLFGVPDASQVDYTRLVRLDLGSVAPSLAGPKRPQDRIEIGDVKARFASLLTTPASEGGFGLPAERTAHRQAVAPAAAPSPRAEPAVSPGAPRDVVEMVDNKPAAVTAAPAPADPGDALTLAHGDVLIAAITSCTNTSNPGVMLAAGLLAKKAVEAGLKVAPHIKTSLAPGSRIVTEYLTRSGLLPYLEKLGFSVAAYGCTTCIGNAGDLAPELNEAIATGDLVCAAVLSGNRNFEARIHPNLKANFLASPPLVVAYAIAGRVTADLMTEPVGIGRRGEPVWLGDIWPTSEEVHALMKHAMDPKAFRGNYAQVASDPGALWQKIRGVTGEVYTWPESTYIAEPPFFAGFSLEPPPVEPGVRGARVMALFGDSITTDHISPAGSFKPTTPAGSYLQDKGVRPPDFNSYGARRGNHEVMMRGTFANVRVKNLMLPPGHGGQPVEGGFTLMQLDGPDRGARTTIFDAAMRYQAAGVPTVVFAGEEYGTGSSRDWAAKGTRLLGVRAVIAESYERIHRSNLIGMGVLPLQFPEGTTRKTLNLDGTEEVDIPNLGNDLKPSQEIEVVFRKDNGKEQTVKAISRLDTGAEVTYFKNGGILHYVLRQMMTD